MKSKKNNFETIDEYISTFPEEVQSILNNLSKIISTSAPKAEEKISYNMPTYYLKGNLIHFAGYKNHIGLYPTPSGIEHFKDEHKGYKTSKGAIQFPIDKPLPEKLIAKIVKYRVKENLERN